MRTPYLPYRPSTSAWASAAAQAGPLTVFEAQRSSDGALTVLLLNKSDSPVTTSVALANFSAGAVERWQHEPGKPGIAAGAAPVVSGGKIPLTVTALSLTLLVIEKS